LIRLRLNIYQAAARKTKGATRRTEAQAAIAEAVDILVTLDLAFRLKVDMFDGQCFRMAQSRIE
jgi:hypothetical protein